MLATCSYSYLKSFLRRRNLVGLLFVSGTVYLWHSMQGTTGFVSPTGVHTVRAPSPPSTTWSRSTTSAASSRRVVLSLGDVQNTDSAKRRSRISHDVTRMQQPAEALPLHAETNQRSPQTSIFVPSKRQHSKGTHAEAESNIPVTGGFDRGKADAFENNIHTSNALIDSEQTIRVEVFPRWTTSKPDDSLRRIYVYSAVLSLHGTPADGSSHVDVVAIMEAGQLPTLTCCAKLAGGIPSLHEGGAAIVRYVFPPHLDLSNVTAKFGNTAAVFRCHFPFTAHQISSAHVIVSAITSCPAEEAEESGYLPVVTPEVVPGGLGLCGKGAFGGGINPRKLLEWFEVQRLLGVDKIVIYDLNNTREEVRRIFRHYQNSGLLDLRPLLLPGKPWRGTNVPEGRIQDTFPHLDCFQRLAGYAFVLAIDTDEIIVPRTTTRLKPFLRDSFFAKQPLAASIQFKVQFFVEEWGPEDPSAPMLVLQYLRCSVARNDHVKYAYVPARALQLQTHKLWPAQGWKKRVPVPKTEAVIFHYRKRPNSAQWQGGDPPRTTDRTMLKFRDELVPRFKAALRDIGL